MKALELSYEDCSVPQVNHSINAQSYNIIMLGSTLVISVRFNTSTSSQAGLQHISIIANTPNQTLYNYDAWIFVPNYTYTMACKKAWFVVLFTCSWHDIINTTRKIQRNFTMKYGWWCKKFMKSMTTDVFNVYLQYLSSLTDSCMCRFCTTSFLHLYMRSEAKYSTIWLFYYSIIHVQWTLVILL